MAAQSFNCPSCGAPLDYDGSGSPTMRCPYCNTSVMVPPELRPRPAPAPRIVTVPAKPAPAYHPQVKPTKGGGWCIAAYVLGIVLFIAFMFWLPNFINQQAAKNSLAYVEQQSRPTEAQRLPTHTPVPSPTAAPSPTPAVGMLSLTFGGEGIGPGLLNDARKIAVDGSGIIYVADYEGGRVQAFDSSGKYLHQWKVSETNTYISGLAANHNGDVFVAFNGGIYRFEGATGKQLGKMTDPRGGEFGDLSATADGGLAAVWYEGRWGIITSLEGHRDDLVLFNAKGKAAKTIPSIISGQTEQLALDTVIAVDGAGNLYALSTRDAAVFKFTPEGRFVNRFGSSGSQPDQFDFASTIAVDGQGRVYVGGGRKVVIFTPGGRFIDSFPSPVSIDSMAFDEQGGLWVVSRDQVTKFEVKLK